MSGRRIPTHAEFCEARSELLAIWGAADIKPVLRENRPEGSDQSGEFFIIETVHPLSARSVPARIHEELEVKAHSSSFAPLPDET